MASLIDMLFSNATRAVAIGIDAGRSLLRIGADLARRFVGTSQRTIDAVINRGRIGRDVGEGLMNSDPLALYPRLAYPRNPTLTAAYRWGVRLQYDNSEYNPNDPKSDPFVYRWVEVTSDVNLPAKWITHNAQTDALNTFYDPQYERRLPQNTSFIPVGIQIVFGERRT